MTFTSSAYHLCLQSTTDSGQSDLTGTLVKCSKPCHVWGGNIRALINKGSVFIDGTSRDHVVEQLFPTNTWGQAFFVQPIRDRSVGESIAKPSSNQRHSKT